MSEHVSKNVEAVYPLSPVQHGMLYHSLLAPRSGAEMRRTLSDSAGRLRDKGREAYDAASDAVGRAVDQGRRAAEAGRARVEDAVNEGRAVFAEQMSGPRSGDTI